MHTHGPWIISGTDTETGTPATISGARGRPVADLYRRNPENAANARLIAAAPDLLAALRALLAHEGEREFSGIGTEHDSDALETAKRAAGAAIDKATK